MKGRVLLLIPLVVIGGIVLGYLSFSLMEQQNGGVELPERIGSFELVSRTTGDSARSQIEKMHFGSPGNIIEASIGAYQRGDGALLHLWLSAFSSTEEAEKSVEDMVLKMREYPELGFSPTQYMIDGRKVYLAVRGGGTHVFWAQGKVSCYLLLSSPDKEEALNLATILIKGQT
jgi:hypothetical protein